MSWTNGDDELARALESGMLERLDHGSVGIVQGGVLANENDADGVKQSLVSDGQVLPHRHELVAATEALLIPNDVVELETLLKVLDETLLLE